MSGHSKWSKVKHQKATTDVVKAQAFTKASRSISIAVREGGGVSDPVSNFRLRLAVEKARMVNMPKENIERAIERGRGVGGVGFEEVTYEGYGPGGVAIIIQAATDNRQRTVSLVKNVLDRYGGTLASPGAVDFLFKRVGIVLVSKDTLTLDQLTEAAIAAGADDIIERDDVFEVFVPTSSLALAKEILEKQKVMIEMTEIIMLPVVSVDVVEQKKQLVSNLVEQIAALDDVQEVYTNLS